MHSRLHFFRKLVLCLGDLFVFQLALLPTLWLRYGSVQSLDWERHIVPFSIVSFFWCVNFYIAGIYQLSSRSEPLKLLRTYLEAMVANLAFSIAFFYLIPFFGIAPRTNLFVHFLVSLLLGYAWHILFQRFSHQPPPLPTLYIGPEDELPSLEALLQDNVFGYELAFAYCDTPSLHPRSHGRVRLLSTTVQLAEAIHLVPIEAVIVHEKHAFDQSLKEVLYHLVFQRVAFFDRSEIEEVIAQRVPVAHISETWLLQHLNEASKSWYEQFKRVTDLFLACVFSLFTCAILPFVWIGSKISSPGPLFYSQTRVGKNGKLFQLWKFRTMNVDAEKDGPQFTAATSNDPRIRRFGKWLRRLRIDELPQVWNVLAGDLSFIGPRPERPEFVQPLLSQEPFYGLRHLTRPGLTGWAQVTFLKPNSTLSDNLTKLQYDLYYIKHRSFVFDITILLKTVGIILRRQGV